MKRHYVGQPTDDQGPEAEKKRVAEMQAADPAGKLREIRKAVKSLVNAVLSVAADMEDLVCTTDRLTGPVETCVKRIAELEKSGLNKVEAQVSQLQLAGCLMAAEGGTSNLVKQGDCSWNQAYRAALELRAYDLLGKKADATRYVQTPSPDLEITLSIPTGSKAKPVATLADGYGGRAQIVAEGSSYVLYLQCVSSTLVPETDIPCRVGDRYTPHYHASPYIFPEALEAMKTLPILKGDR